MRGLFGKASQPLESLRSRTAIARLEGPPKSLAPPDPDPSPTGSTRQANRARRAPPMEETSGAKGRTRPRRPASDGVDRRYRRARGAAGRGNGRRSRAPAPNAKSRTERPAKSSSQRSRRQAEARAARNAARRRRKTDADGDLCWLTAWRSDQMVGFTRRRDHMAARSHGDVSTDPTPEKAVERGSATPANADQRRRLRRTRGLGPSADLAALEERIDHHHVRRDDQSARSAMASAICGINSGAATQDAADLQNRTRSRPIFSVDRIEPRRAERTLRAPARRRSPSARDLRRAVP